ncbi:MAG: dihydroneopterin aldolase [Dysgonamonadaceae bacterium]|jgi:dihydroneopterin aldolase|nr:dihydroneopterin aldolase [Dysgonamonadaceae bacterium]
MAYIELKNMEFFAHHGVFEQERQIGGRFTVDLKIKLDLMAAASSDRLEDTLNYAAVFDMVKEEMSVPSKLIENVAGRILARLSKDFPTVEDAKIRLAKINPPVNGVVAEAAVELSLNDAGL